MSDILDTFIKTPGVSPVGSMFLDGNELSRIPSLIVQYICRSVYHKQNWNMKMCWSYYIHK